MIRARFWLLLLLLLGLPVSAGADDISATARGVVRIVTIAVVDDEVVGFGHGSGFAIAPNRIVTNAHVVELAERYPGNVVIGVVPSEGDKSYQGKVIAYDTKRDLALIEFAGAPLPTAALYTGPVTEGDAVIALGYPGNVDLATAQSAADYIRPTSPVRSEGGFSGRRALTGIEVLLHTASIARGNSGGPLLDRCGRVIGVNSAITRGEEGDSSFGFAIADTELAAFLREAKQPFATVGSACTSIEDRLRQDNDADSRAIADAATATREAATRSQIAREEAREKVYEESERLRENVMAVAALLLVAGALAIGGAGMLDMRGERRAAIWAAACGGLGIVAAIVVFVLRPSGEARLPIVSAATIIQRTPGVVPPKLICTIVPERSRITISSAGDVPFGWTPSGCVNGRTQYIEAAHGWERILVPDEEQTVSVLSFDPATLNYANTRYLLSAGAMEALRKLRVQGAPKTCSTDPQVIDKLSQQQAAIRAALPPLPNEKLVYSCKPAG